MIADDAVRDQVAATLVEQLFENADVSSGLEERLPEDQQQLAGPLAAAIRVLADRLAQELLARPRAQELWVNAMDLAHERLIRVLEDEATFLATEEGAVVLDLQPLLVQLGEEVAVFNNLESRLPEDAGRIQIMEGDQLETAQDLTGILDAIGTWFWVVPFGLAIAGIALARGRRRQELRAVAVAAILVGLGLFALRGLAGGYIVDSLVTTESVRPAAENAWEILTNLLADSGWTLIGIGVIALIGVWLAAPTGSGRSARAALAPILGRRTWAFGTVAVLFLLLLWWNPTAQTGRLPQMLFAAALLAVAVEALHRQTARDFPEESAVTPGDAFRARMDALRGRTARRDRPARRLTRRTRCADRASPPMARTVPQARRSLTEMLLGSRNSIAGTVYGSVIVMATIAAGSKGGLASRGSCSPPSGSRCSCSGSRTSTQTGWRRASRPTAASRGRSSCTSHTTSSLYPSRPSPRARPCCSALSASSGAPQQCGSPSSPGWRYSRFRGSATHEPSTSAGSPPPCPWRSTCPSVSRSWR